MPRTALFLLHALGGSARAWDAVMARIGPGVACRALDLPGFGARADQGYADVERMVDGVIDVVRSARVDRWIIVGHSMGGKIATLVAARAGSGEVGLEGLAGVALIAASPPGPEPMDEDRRAEMLAWAADGRFSRTEAARFVDANTAERLPDRLRDAAMDDVQRSAPMAWRGWLERDSREDWSAQVDRIAVPALIVAGAEDGDLGEAAQRRLNLPHYPEATLHVVDGAAHLLPLERPDAVARLIADLAGRGAAQDF
ncbi:alpha/beta hydrolase [Sphingomonas sp.]|uniref:alpha/beta fold hydrolase n=1 Tax=Sphingomonas sp. TaxID=28214 RepID=UPI0031D225D3